MSDLDALGLAIGQPVGVSPAADLTLVSIGTVISVDASARAVTVGIRGDLIHPVRLPATAARYRPGGLCHVLHNPQDSGRAVRVIGAVDPLPPAVLGLLVTAGSSPTFLATVTVFETNYQVQYSAATYTVGSRVWVELDDWGVPFRMDGSSPELVPTPGPSGPGSGGSAGSVHATVSIGPQWSGTWRASRGEYDRWNTGTYGGRATLYQGNGFGSGALTGLAVYGDQLVNLGASSFDRVQVALRDVGLSGASGPAVVQGAPQASPYPGAPTPSGPTAAGMGLVDLPSGLREALRTGAARGLALVGANYWAVAGAGTGDGMTLLVTYSRPA